MINLLYINRILMVSPARLGDTIFCVPAIRFLKQSCPHLKIDVVALSDLAAEVLQDNPDIHRIIPVSSDELSAGDYDLGINIHDSEKAQNIFSALTCSCEHYDVTRYPNRHQVDKLLKFLSETFGLSLENFRSYYQLYPRVENLEKIKQLLIKNSVNLSDHVLIGYHLGCHGLAKNRKRLWNRLAHPKAWPLKNFIKLSKEFKKMDSNIRIVITGSGAEETIGNIFCRHIPDAINLINQTSVLDLYSLMSQLKLFVSNDTGAMHVACAADIPLVALFGKSDPLGTGPYPKSDKRIVLHHQNIAKISVKQVLQKVHIFIANCCVI